MSTGWMTITGSRITDSSKVALVRGKIWFTPVNRQGEPMAYHSVDGQVVFAPVPFDVVNGYFTGTLPDGATTSPRNIGFRVVIEDQYKNHILGPKGYSFVQPSSDPAAAAWCNATDLTCNFDEYPPDFDDLPQLNIVGGGGGGIGPTGQPGPKGDPGTPATVTVASTTTLSAGSQAAVTNHGTPSAAALAFGIPQGAQGIKGDKGDKGDQGPAATVALGAVNTLSPGSQATVANGGTSSAATLNFGIPAGAKGDKGDQGNQGEKGDPGAPALINSFGYTAPGTQITITNVGTASAPAYNITVPFPTVAATTTTLPAGSAATVAVLQGANGTVVLAIGIPSGAGSGTGTNTGTGTTSAVGLVLTDGQTGSNYYVFASNGQVSSTPYVAQPNAPAAVSSATLIDETDGHYYLLTIENGVLASPSATQNGAGAVASIPILDSVTSATLQMKSSNGVLVC